MNQKIFTVLFISIVLLSACSKDNVIEQNDDRFKIILGNSRKTMTWVTNQNQDILFSGFPDEIHDTLFLMDVSESDTINLNLGYTSNGHFGINTYRDIEDGFDYQSATRFDNNLDCDYSFVQGEGNKIIRLEVKGIQDFDEIYFPDAFDRIIGKTDTSIFITSIMYNENDFIITILPKGTSIYKSYFLTNHKWSNKVDATIYEQKIDIADFSDAIVHDRERNSTFTVG